MGHTLLITRVIDDLNPTAGVEIYDLIGFGINHAVLFICSDVEGVLKSANGTEYGLASGVFTKDLSKVSVINTGILNLSLGVKTIVAPLQVCCQVMVLFY